MSISSDMQGVTKSMNYYLSLRKKRKRSYFYAFFIDPKDPRKYELSVSVELLRKKLNLNSEKPITKEREAYAVVERAITEGLINFNREKKLFTEYCLEYWNFETSEYIKRRNQKSPNSIGKDYAITMYRNFKLHALPLLPKTLNLADVKASHVEKVMDTLLDANDLSNATIQKVIQSIAGPLKEATRKKLVAHNPMDGVEPLTSTYKKRGIYTIEELIKIMDILYKKGTIGVDEIKKVRGPDKTLVEKSFLVKTDLKPYLSVALATYTGMRSGEIRALRIDQIHIVNEEYGIITVDRAVNVYAGEKSTKGKRSREVPVPAKLCLELINMAQSSPYPNNTRVFWSTDSEENPIASSYLRNQLYKAINHIGITDEERIERNIDFHSLRHSFNSSLRGKVEDKSLMAIVGHESIEMTNRYTHSTQKELLDVGKAISSLFSKETTKDE